MINRKATYMAMTILMFLSLSYVTTAQTPNQVQETLIKGMEYRLVGPFRGGRSCSVTGVPGHDDLYYFGSVGGGVWRTQDAGKTYENISDGYFGGSIGAVAVAEADPNIIYAGQGEKTVRGNVSSGFGVWKSEDAGKTWIHVGLKDTRHIGRIRIDPNNPDIVYVAAMGDLWKSSDKRGVYKTINGGKTWEKILFANKDAGAVDLVIDPNNTRVLFASTWNVRRTPYNFSSGGPGSDLWKSTDAGASWTKLTDLPNMPKGPIGIIGVSISPANSNRVYAIVEAKEGGVFRSDDGGASWKKMSRNRALRSRAWYYSRIIADTQDEDKVYVLNVSYGVSTDGGATWSLHNAPHGDHHDLWIDPDNNQRMVIADDGGAQISTNAGTNWTTYYNQPTSQFYRIATDNHFPYRIYGAQQDNSAIRISHRSGGNSIGEDDWEVTAGGESAYHAIDPTDNEIVYGGTYKGYMTRLNHRTGQRRSINVWPLNPAGSGVEVMKYRFNWNTPVLFSQHETDKLYVFSNQVHMTTNGGQSYETVSPDLTRNDPATLKSSGGPITQDNTGVEFYANIFTMMESPHEKGVLWVGSDDGLVHVTTDNCANWKDVTPKQAPRMIMWNSIDPHPTNPQSAYLAGTMYKSGDFKPYLYKTENMGRTWKLITSGIDPQHFTRVVRADPKRAGLLYAGTEYGIYASFDDGNSWMSFQQNLPLVPITDLAVKNDNLIVATQGRSFWIIDDLTPLHQMDKKALSEPAYLYEPMPTDRIKAGGRGRRNPLLQGENHPNGVMVYYHLMNEIKEGDILKLSFYEIDGSLIKSFESKEGSDLMSEEGMNRFVWNMRYPDAVSFPGMVLYSSNTRGPLAAPGKYEVRMTINDQELSQDFIIEKDPRGEATDEDLQAQFDFLISVRDKLSEANQAVVDIREMRKDLEYIKGKIAKSSSTKPIADAIEKMEKEMTIIENNIHETRNEARQDPLNFGIKLNNRLAYLATHESSGDFRPTDQSIAYKKEVSAQIDKEVKDLEILVKEKVAQINQLLKDADIPMLGLGPIKP